MKAPISRPNSTIDDLENDRAALHCAWLLCVHALTEWPDLLGNDGDPDAVLAWLLEKRAETENSIDALSGTGMPPERGK